MGNPKKKPNAYIYITQQYKTHQSHIVTCIATTSLTFNLMETGLAVVIVSLYCGYAAGGAESGADNVKYVQLGDSQRFCCPAISYCSSHSTVISWYRCVDTELSAESCQQPVPGVKSKQLPVGSAWVSETGELSFFNFSLQAVGTYCCTQHDNARQCVKMSILPSGE